jgi:YD repeat-containing protein
VRRFEPLTAVTTPDGTTWRYRYDPLGRRVAKQRSGPSGAPAEEAIFTWDGAALAEESARRPGHPCRVTWGYGPGPAPASHRRTVGLRGQLPGCAPQMS